MSRALTWEASVLTTFSLVLGVLPGVAKAEEITPARQTELIHLLKHDCGSCHGMTLKGGLGTPPLPSDTADTPPELLRQIILDGIPGTAMPGWRALLTEAEAGWLVTLLQQGIPDEK